MNKANRDNHGQFARRRGSPAQLLGFWAASLISLGLLYAILRVVMADFGAFRSCNGDTNILTITSCGKQSLNFGDFILLGLLGLSALFSFSLFTGAWRITRKGKVIA